MTTSPDPARPLAPDSTDPGRALAPERKSLGRRILGWLFIAVGILVSLMIVVAGFYVWRVWTTANDIQRDGTLLPDGERPPAAATGSFNYVLMGSDSRSEDDQGRSDVLMLAHVPAARDKVYLVSFPRDMWVEIPGRGYDKINAAYSYGGGALATRTLESLVGVRMDHAARIDFDGFVGLTTELGGVTVNNRVASSSKGKDGVTYSWPKGEVTLQGEDALAFVRQRYDLPNGDLDRAERQRAVVKGILRKMMTGEVLANPVTFNGVMGRLGQYFTVDGGLTNDVLLSTATSMRVNGGDDIRLLQAPISGFGRSPNGASIDVVNVEQLAELAQAVRTGHMDDYYEKYEDQPFAGAKK